jgi:hypothetical protein
VYAAKPSEIYVQGNGVEISSNDFTPDVADDTEFGSVSVGGWVEHTFTIGNTGQGDLVLDGAPTVQFQGGGSPDFTVTGQPGLTTMAKDGTTTFVVRFTPTGSGLKSATISISNNDNNENPYVFDIQGTASSPTPPTLASPPSATGIEDTTATLGGEVTDIGSGNVTERGIYWSTINGFSPPGQGTKVSSTGDWGTGTFSENVTGLPEASLVYFRSFAANSAGTDYSSQLDFQTEPSTQASGITFSNVDTTTMTVNWSGSGSGDGVVVVIKEAVPVDADPADGTEHAADPAYTVGADLGGANYVLFRGSGSSVDVTGLTPDTTYHVAVYAYAGTGSGLAGINYQQDLPARNSQATLADISAPTIANPSHSAIEATTATLGGEVTSINNANVTERGVYWSTVDGFTPPGQGTKVSSTGSWDVGTFSENVTGLPESSIVHYRAFAVNSAGTSYTTQSSFQTEPATQASGVTFSSVGANQMQVDWSGSGSGDGVIVVIKQGGAVDADPSDGAEHAADPGYGLGEDLGGANHVVFRASGSSVVVTNLLSDTTYHVAVYAYAGSGIDPAGINYQQDLPARGSQKTLLVTAPPTVANPSQTAVQDTSATLGGEVTSTNNAAVTERGIYWSTLNGFSPPAQGSKVSSAGTWGTGTFSENVTGLPESDMVYYRAFAVNSEGTGFSAQAAFQTEPSTQVSGLTITDVTDSSMQINWSDSGSGDGVIVVMKKGSAVDALPVDGTEHNANAQFGSGAQLGTGNHVVFRASGTSMVATGLDPESTYHVAVYAYAGAGTGAAGINYQQDLPATEQATTLEAVVTPTVPTVVNATPSAIEATTATLGGNVTATNYAPITERGIYWSSTDGFTPPGQGAKVASTGNWGTGSFSENVTGLNQGSLIYYRAFAANSAGAGYASQSAFQTEPSVQASAPNFSSTTDTETTLQWTSGNGDGTLVVIRLGEPATRLPADGSEYAADPGYGNGDSLGGANYAVYRASGNSVTITNLEPNSVYYVSLFEYAGSGSGLAGVNYQQDAPASANVQTLIGQTWMGHNRKYGITDCNMCHGTHFGFGVPHDAEQESTTCGQCHNPTGVASNKFDVSLHYDSNSNVLADCGDCHEVHGGSDLSSVITFDDHTGTTGTNLSYFRVETTRHPQAIGRGVFHNAGPNSEDYAFTNAAPFNGACQVCHTATSHHTNTGVDVGHGNGAACTDCHSHSESFQGAGGTDCTVCHASGQGPYRAVVPDFGLMASHIPGGAVTTNDCMTCHHEEYGNSYHGNNMIDLRNVDDDSVVSIAPSLTRNTASKNLEADVVAVQNNFCLKCHDSNGANGNATPFSTGGTPPDINTALNTGNAYFHPVLGPGSNPLCDSSSMKSPWNQTSNTGPLGDGHDVISCFDCHGVNGHGSANNNMLRVQIAGPTDGANIALFCRTCHDDQATGNYHTKGQHGNPIHTDNGDGPYGCRGCHSGQQEPDTNNDYPSNVTLESAALDIHGGNFVWPAGTGKTGAGTTSQHFINGGWLEGWSSGACYPDGNCQHTSQSY